MSNDLRARITKARTTVEWMNFAPDDSRRVTALNALDDAARYLDRCENAIEVAQAAIERPPAITEVDWRRNLHDLVDGGEHVMREPVHPRSSQTVRGEIRRGGAT